MVDAGAFAIVVLISLVIFFGAPIAATFYLVHKGSDGPSALGWSLSGFVFGIVAGFVTMALYFNLPHLPHEGGRMSVGPDMYFAGLTFLVSPAIGVGIGILGDRFVASPHQHRGLRLGAVLGLTAGLGLLAIASAVASSFKVPDLLAALVLWIVLASPAVGAFVGLRWSGRPDRDEGKPKIAGGLKDIRDPDLDELVP